MVAVVLMASTVVVSGLIATRLEERPAAAISFQHRHGLALSPSEAQFVARRRRLELQMATVLFGLLIGCLFVALSNGKPLWPRGIVPSAGLGAVLATLVACRPAASWWMSRARNKLHRVAVVDFGSARPVCPSVVPVLLLTSTAACLALIVASFAAVAPLNRLGSATPWMIILFPLAVVSLVSLTALAVLQRAPLRADSIEHAAVVTATRRDDLFRLTNVVAHLQMSPSIAAAAQLFRYGPGTLVGVACPALAWGAAAIQWRWIAQRAKAPRALVAA